MKKPDKKSILHELDLLRVVALLGVVAIHTDVITASKTNYVGGVSWWLVVVVHSLSVVAVPLFVMLSGYLTAKKIATGSPKKRMSMLRQRLVWRLGVPLLIWQGIYWFWHALWWGQRLSLLHFANLLLLGWSNHLYYLYVLISVTALFFFLSTYTNLLKKYSALLLFVSFLGGVVLTAVWYFYFQKPLLPSLTMGIPYMGYFIFGWYMARNYTKKITVFPGVGVFFPMLVVLMTATSALFFAESVQASSSSFWTENGGYYFWDSLSPLTVTASLAVFYTLATFPSAKVLASWLSKRLYLRKFSEMSFGVYLVHPLVIEFLDRYGGLAVHTISWNLFLYFIVKMVLVTSLSFATVFFWHKSKVAALRLLQS